MIEDPVSHALRPFDFDHLIDNVPKIKKLNYEIEHYTFTPPIDSSDMQPDNWKQLARTIEENYSNYDGFVVLHGTDTMAYTASALSFMLDNLRKPVIITGSQLPIGEVRTDGEENLITAIQIAAQQDCNTNPLVQEVAILFENYLWRGNRSTKMSADNFNAFKSNNFPPLAQIGLGIHYNQEALYRVQGMEPLKVHYQLDPSVLILTLFPGLSEATLRYQLNTPDIKGIVLRTFGAGNTPTEGWFTQAISDAISAGKVIVNVTQCVNGGVMRRYESAGKLENIGVISGHDITVEAAITKMMYLFGLGYSTEEVRRLLKINLRGELTI